jgi:hypothetical protein
MSMKLLTVIGTVVVEGEIGAFSTIPALTTGALSPLASEKNRHHKQIKTQIIFFTILLFSFSSTGNYELGTKNF